jgi:hypothetical protein
VSARGAAERHELTSEKRVETGAPAGAWKKCLYLEEP